MYVIRTRSNGTDSTLIEMTRAEYVAALEADFKNMLGPGGRTSHKQIPADQARKLVKEGIIHETSLWVNDEGRVCYARADPHG